MPSPDKILRSNSKSIEICGQHLREDQLVAVPTETVYGLAGNALSESAVRKIFEVKGRPFIDPLITHFKDAQSAFKHVYACEKAIKLANTFWPGPLTLVLQKSDSIPDLVTAGLSTAAVRVPNHPLLQELLRKLDFPLAAPSANPFGYVSPTRPEHVSKTLGSKIAAILDGGFCSHGLESTVIEFHQAHNPRILRPGPISAEEIKNRTGLIIHTQERDGHDNLPQTSPGLLSKHYSPHTPIDIIENGQVDWVASEDEAIILNKKPDTLDSDHVYWLSENGDLGEIARNLFDLIQKLDGRAYRKLTVEAAQNESVGSAINDRLRRAAR
ncbi:MAG: L-threonylcarbamoyladenylate synthase [Verrucomicrobiota bacterium]